MPKYTTQDIRNLALLGHGASGKTTLAEALLHAAGAIGHIGEVEKGNTVCDYEAEEKHHKHSLVSAVVHLDYGERHINLIDTPGYPDFAGQAYSILPAVETAMVVVNATSGIEMMTRRIMDKAAERKLCRMIVINKIDAENVDLEGLVGQLQESFGPQCLPINLPSGGGAGVIDVFSRAEGRADFSDVHEAHKAIIEQCVEVDEEVAMEYLEGGEVAEDKLHAVFEKALREGHLVPICFVSAKKQVGIGELLDLIAKLAPSPTEGNPRPFIRGEPGDADLVEFHAEADPAKHVLAHVFKVSVDPFVGRLGIFRVHQGTITKESQLFIGDARKPFKVGHLFKMQGKEHVEIDAGLPGDICAVAKVEEAHYDAVLHDSHDEDHIHLKPLDFPKPMYGLAIIAKSRGDETKISKALHALTSEDPCCVVERDAITHETIIRGLGDMHLRMCLEKMKNRYNVDVDTHPPKIAYKETITAKADGHHRHKKQTGGAGQFGEVYLRVVPQDRGAGFEFVNDTFGGSIPNQFIPAIEKGVRMVLDQGAIAGYPLQDVRVEVYDGKYHPVDSKEVAFVTAGKRAFIDAVTKAKPVVLEPIVLLEITVPEQNMGDIAGDLSGKRGRIQGQEVIPGGMCVVRAQAPLAELTNYQSQIKSVTGGQGSYSMEFSHYEAVPPQVQQQIVAAYQPKVEED